MFMDAEHEWVVNDDVDSLINVVFNCKKELTKICFSKFSAAKIIELKVYAPQKICDFLLLSDGCASIKDESCNTHCHKLISEFDQFKLFKTKIFGNTTVRLEAMFDAGEQIIGRFFYGNITVIDCNNV
jgi:hypothetical protein